MDYYELLGVPRDATSALIRKAFRKKAAVAHPDRKGGDADLMARLNTAYDVLSNETRRKHYDTHGEDAPPPQAPDHEERAAILMLLSQILDKAPEDADLLLIVRQQLAQNYQKLVAAEEQQKAQLRQLERQRKRFKFKPKEGLNFIDGLFEDKLRIIKNNLEACKHNLKVCERAQEIVNYYDFEALQGVVRPTPTTSVFCMG